MHFRAFVLDIDPILLSTEQEQTKIYSLLQELHKKIIKTASRSIYRRPLHLAGHVQLAGKAGASVPGRCIVLNSLLPCFRGRFHGSRFTPLTPNSRHNLFQAAENLRLKSDYRNVPCFVFPLVTRLKTMCSDILHLQVLAEAENRTSNAKYIHFLLKT